MPERRPSSPRARASSRTSTVVHIHRGFPHGLHLLITLLTCGLWLPVWILLALFSRS